MAVINKTGITNGVTIEAEHITRAIDALSGVSTDTIIATGSFSGSFSGLFSGLSTTSTSASFATTASFAQTASAVAVTDTTSGTGPYYVTFVDGTTGVRSVRVDSNTNALSFNATTNLLSTTASNAVTSSFATTASYALNAGSSSQNFFTIQFKGNNFSGLGSTSTKYYPLITGDISTSSGSAVILNSFVSPIAATIVSMSVSVYNALAGASEVLRFYSENTTSKVGGTNVNLSFTGKSSSGRGPAGNVSVSAGDVISYAFLCSSGTFPTGSYVDLSILLKS